MSPSDHAQWHRLDPLMCRRTVKRFGIDGTLQQTWRLQRINDMVLTPDGQALLYIAVDKKINVLRLKEDREVCSLLAQWYSWGSTDSGGLYPLLPLPFTPSPTLLLQHLSLLSCASCRPHPHLHQGWPTLGRPEPGSSRVPHVPQA